MIINTINDYHHNQWLSAHYPKTMTQMTAKYSVSLNALGSVNSPNEVNIGPEIRLKIEAKNPLVSKSKRENNWKIFLMNVLGFTYDTYLDRSTFSVLTYKQTNKQTNRQTNKNKTTKPTNNESVQEVHTIITLTRRHSEALEAKTSPLRDSWFRSRKLSAPARPLVDCSLALTTHCLH